MCGARHRNKVGERTATPVSQQLALVTCNIKPFVIAQRFAQAAPGAASTVRNVVRIENIICQNDPKWFVNIVSILFFPPILVPYSYSFFSVVVAFLSLRIPRGTWYEVTNWWSDSPGLDHPYTTHPSFPLTAYWPCVLVVWSFSWMLSHQRSGQGRKRYARGRDDGRLNCNSSTSRWCPDGRDGSTVHIVRRGTMFTSVSDYTHQCHRCVTSDHYIRAVIVTALTSVH